SSTGSSAPSRWDRRRARFRRCKFFRRWRTIHAVAERVRRARILVIDDGLHALGSALRSALAPEHVLVTVSNAPAGAPLLAEAIRLVRVWSGGTEAVERIGTPVWVVDKPFDPVMLRALIRAHGWRPA